MKTLARSRLLLVLALLAAGVSRPAQAHWSRTFGGAGTGEGIQALRELASGELVVLASTDSFGTLTGDAWLIRLDADGRAVARFLAGNAAPGGLDGAVILEDGGAVFSHRNVRDIFIRHEASISRMNADGSIAWTTDVVADPGRFFVNDLIAMSNGTFIGVGQAALSDAGPHVGWVIAFDADGSVLWQQYHGGVIDTGISFDSGIETAGGGFAVTGSMASGANGEDLLVAQLTGAGAIQWVSTLGGSGGDRGASLVELPGGGFAIAGSTDSFTSSGHAGWIVRVNAMGGLMWDAVLGDAEWSDLQAIALGADGRIVALGRISEPGFPTNDLWALGLDPATGGIAWQRAYEGASGDFANEIAILANQDLLLGGVWAWGFAEEDLWLLRTDAAGLIDGCPLLRDTSVAAAGSRARVTSQFLPPYPPFGTAAPGTVVTDASGLTETTQCEIIACPPLDCGAIVASPDPACEGELVTLSVEVVGGTPPHDVTWDLDGDGLPDAMGNPLVTPMPAGTTTVTAFVTDACAAPLSCQAAHDAIVLSLAPPGEVSDVRAGAPPLLVLESGTRILFEEIAGATAYSVHAGIIGDWYLPDAPSGSACFVATLPADPLRLAATPVLAAGTWLVVTASNACAEGSAGHDSFGAGRQASGTWSSCGGFP